jgi:hypothetical protein
MGRSRRSARIPTHSKRAVEKRAGGLQAIELGVEIVEAAQHRHAVAEEVLLDPAS